VNNVGAMCRLISAQYPAGRRVNSEAGSRWRRGWFLINKKKKRKEKIAIRNEATMPGIERVVLVHWSRIGRFRRDSARFIAGGTKRESRLRRETRYAMG